MNFNEHSELEGLHAFLSPSRYHWINYDEEKLDTTYKKALATQRGIELHDFACRCIRLKQNLPKSKKSLNAYVNDAIGFKMIPEQKLVYSDNCFGTADTISFRKNSLRIHDFKSGETPASIKQLEVYTALFCLEYNYKPHDIKMELRIYQNDEIFVHEPNPANIFHIINKIVLFDRIIEKIKTEGEE